MFSKFSLKLSHLKLSVPLLVVVITLLVAGVVYAAYVTIDSTPLSIDVSEELLSQVSHSGGEQIFGGHPGSFGTSLAIAGNSTLYGFQGTPFTKISQTAVTGDGSPGDPFTVETTVDVGTTGLRIVQTDIYTAGEESYRTDLTVENTTGSAVDVILYRSLDCMVGGGDAGYGWQTPAGGVACTENPDNTPAGITEKFEDISGGANYIVDGYSPVFNAVKSRNPLPDTVKTDNGYGGVYDNGMAISWSIDNVPSGGAVTRSHLTAFDNTGYGSNPVPGETIDVGNAAVGSSVTTTLTISETGSLPLTVSSYSIRGDHPDEFSITDPNFPFSINDGGANTDVTIECSPTVISPTRSASLIIRHNAPSGETTYPLICNASEGGSSTIYLPLIMKEPCACVCPNSATLSTACCN